MKNKIIYWIFTLWLALGLVSTGIVQLLKSGTGAGGVDSIIRLGYPVYVMPLLGVWKIFGAVVLLVPGFSLLKEWAYAGVFFAMTGAAYSHIVSGSSVGELVPSLLMLVLNLLSWYFRPADRKILSVNR